MKCLKDIVYILKVLCRQGRTSIGFPEKSILLWNAMVSGYASLGKVEEAKVFYGMPMKDAASRNSLISGRQRKTKDVVYSMTMIDSYLKCGRYHRSFTLFHVLQLVKIRPTSTWTAVIVGLRMNCCCRKAPEFRTRQRGSHYFESMSKDYSLLPRIEPYGCMVLVDLLGWGGLLEAALEPDSVIWDSLFSTWQVHKKVDAGEKVMENLLSMDLGNRGSYVILSCIYAGTGRWDDVAKMGRR
ncbi:pentatricopeptide repeat-containing protein At5g15300-like [Macadamia integrifolia]|uniref:pentatricopeptide repeat-containing protein At5g15300-like n=1 Tax=Macadamia integrifolia TaxID=60698 RepID=UPI001C4EDF49|nr:pentatricopeptide repeat-containing protein At5g15300-like [Macadamia integrifolia]